MANNDEPASAVVQGSAPAAVVVNPDVPSTLTEPAAPAAPSLSPLAAQQTQQLVAPAAAPQRPGGIFRQLLRGALEGLSAGLQGESIDELHARQTQIQAAQQEMQLRSQQEKRAEQEFNWDAAAAQFRTEEHKLWMAKTHLDLMAAQWNFDLLKDAQKNAALNDAKKFANDLLTRQAGWEVLAEPDAASATKAAGQLNQQQNTSRYIALPSLSQPGKWSVYGLKSGRTLSPQTVKFATGESYTYPAGTEISRITSDQIASLGQVYKEKAETNRAAIKQTQDKAAERQRHAERVAAETAKQSEYAAYAKTYPSGIPENIKQGIEDRYAARMSAIEGKQIAPYQYAQPKPQPQSTPQIQVGQRVTLRDGRTVTVTAVHPNGTFDYK